MLALTLAALLLRLAGLDFGLPHMLEQDAEIPNQVIALRDGANTPATRRDFGTYPLLTAYLAAATTEPAPVYARSDDATLEQHLAAAGDPLFDVRATVAVTSVLIVPATFFLARNFLGPWWSVLATALVAFSTLNQNLSQQCRPHSVAAVFVTLALVGALRVLRTGSTAAYAWLGVAFCLGFGTLHSAIAVGLPIVCAHVARAGWRRAIDWQLGLSLGLGALALPIFYPFLWQAETTQLEGDKLTTGTHEIHASWFDGSGAEAVLRGLWFYEPLLLVLAVGAVGVWVAGALRRGSLVARTRDASGLVLASYALPYLAALTVYGKTLDRFVIPLLPVLAVFAVWGVTRALAGLGDGPRRLGALLVVASLALPVAASLQLARVRAAPDTLSEAADWVREHAGDTPVFLAPRPLWIYSNSSIDLPIGRTAEALKPPGGPGRGTSVYNRWSKYQRHLEDRQGPAPRFNVRWIWWFPKDVEDFVGPRDEFFREHPAATFASTGPGLYVIEVFDTRPKTDIIELRRALRLCGSLEARISPDHDPDATELPLVYRDGQGDWPHMTKRLLGARAWGPVIEVYRVTEESLLAARPGALR